ncbi:DUF2934 domain-containing protein [Ancylobacter dichloromethanicus]|uniref:DUF2934 domain-containing protein n=1 Tax=Ancylobacter dichloromethanicus TaxID=518825 RepID=A0A9W6JDW1_9HYPH|nr:DUF2934 domain-containing protein [Ancylobacter dichloromethanicus]MBS7552905.1 DUF2934 domain-containing protein [Ancylobacter dichloromethanicus]GLK74508.1 hypothetical protein GCM10017643_46260 [Ancylobacter dichloromethanicus]
MDQREDRIRERAHRLWEDEGRPEGRADAHWFRAEEMAAVENDSAENFEPVDAAEPSMVTGEASVDPGGTAISRRSEINPDGTPHGDEPAPVSEIETIRRTLEVPIERRGKVSPLGDPEGAMSGEAGRRL